MNATITKIPTGTIPTIGHPSEAIEKMTPAEASTHFSIKVDELQRSTGRSYQDAWRDAKILNPQLAAKMSAGDQVVTTPQQVKATALGNDGGVPEVPRIFSPGMKTMLGLPTDADELECSTAWAANRGLTTPRDSQTIWENLSALWQGRKADQPKLMVTRFMTERFPLLAQEVDANA